MNARRSFVRSILFVAVLCMSCQPAPSPAPDLTEVGQACAHLRDVCHDSETTDAGVPCEAWLDASACGVVAKACLDVTCIRTAADCAVATKGCGR